MSKETEAAEAGKVVYPSSLCHPETERVQMTLGIIGWFLSLLPGMVVRFWSHQQCFVFPWEPAEEEFVPAETLASTG